MEFPDNMPRFIRRTNSSEVIPVGFIVWLIRITAHVSTAAAKLNDEREWAEFYEDAYQEAADEFTALFNSYETMRTKSGKLMMRRIDSGSYRFAKKG